MKKTSENINHLEKIVDNIEQSGICLKEDRWKPTEEMLKTFVDNAENLGIKINKSYKSITPEDISPVFEKMNTWMEEIIKLKQENDVLTQENRVLRQSENQPKID